MHSAENLKEFGPVRFPFPLEINAGEREAEALAHKSNSMEVDDFEGPGELCGVLHFLPRREDICFGKAGRDYELRIGASKAGADDRAVVAQLEMPQHIDAMLLKHEIGSIAHL